MKHPYKTIDRAPTSARDLCHLMVGDWLGSGQNRDVYEVPINASFIIKHEPRGRDFQNQAEWRIWESVKGTTLEKWFAPCWSISPNGHWLVQRRVEFPERDKYPKKLPDFFGDTKYNNFGLFEKRWVACDYGFPSYDWLFSRHLRLMKTKWKG